MKHRRRQNAVRRQKTPPPNSGARMSVRGKWAREQPAEEYIEGYIRGLQKLFPGKSLIQLLPWAARENPTAAKAMVERIKRNQGNKLSPEDAVFLQQITARLAKQKDCALG